MGLMIAKVTPPAVTAAADVYEEPVLPGNSPIIFIVITADFILFKNSQKTYI